MYYLNGDGVEIIHTDNIFTVAGNHISCRNLLRPGWVYVNTENANNGDGRMVAIKLDGSEVIENFGHSFEVSGNGIYAWAGPVPSPNGATVMFKSNFGDISSDDKIVSYMTYPIFNLSITDGGGEGLYEMGEVVSIVADDALPGKVFFRWTSEDGGIFLDENLSSTTFTMPGGKATIVANYRAAAAPEPVFNSDTDGDGIPNDEDPDVDGDGIANADDISAAGKDMSRDFDNDGRQDALDSDRDGDGIPNTEDVGANGEDLSWDSDNDGINNGLDLDDDNDGISDVDEAQAGTNPLAEDTNGDGIADVGGSLDSDNDGLSDDIDPFPNTHSSASDLDGDGVMDDVDDDIDGDGVNNDKDLSVFDADGDGTYNNHDDDVDGDGIANSDEDAGQSLDHDNDGLPDEVDDDIDNDGISNDIEMILTGDPHSSEIKLVNLIQPLSEEDLSLNPNGATILYKWTGNTGFELSDGKITVVYEAGSLSGSVPIFEVFSNPLTGVSFPEGTIFASPILEIYGTIVDGKQVMVGFPLADSIDISNDEAGNFLVQAFNEKALVWEDQALNVALNKTNHTLETHFDHFSLWRVLRVDEPQNAAAPEEEPGGQASSDDTGGAGGGCLIRLLDK